MAKRTSKERALRRKQMLRAWEPFVQVHHLVSDSPDGDRLDDHYKSKDTTVWENNRYFVHREPVPSDQHGLEGNEVVWLSIKPRDDSARHDWREFQWIKNELCGEDWEAVELYPAERRLVDGVNQFHLWCMAPPAVFPFGWWSRNVVEGNTKKYGSQRDWERGMKPSDAKTEEQSDAEIAVIADALRKGEDISQLTQTDIQKLVKALRREDD